jgi:HK97 family phage portal protein
MGLFSSAFGQSSSIGDSGGWFMRAVGGKTAAGTSPTEFTAMQLPAVYACFNRISNPLAGFPIKIMKPKKGGGAEEVTDHPMSSGKESPLGLRPNPFMSSRTIRKTVQCHALAWGNGYVEIERNNAGQAVGLWPLLPWNTSPVRENSELFYRTTIAGRQFEIDQGNVLHIMDISQDGYVGLSPIRMAREALGLAKALEQFGGKFFANDAKSGGFLMHPGKLSANAQSNLGNRKGAAGEGSSPAAPLEKQGGLDNAFRVKVLEEGMKYIATTIPPEDAQFLGTRLAQIAEIARMYDVPLILLQSHDGTPSWGTGIEQLMIGFVRQTIAPWVGAWEQELNWKLFTQEEREQGYYVKFNMNALLRGDSAARAQFYREMFSVAGMSPNQICALEDMDPIGPDGDHHFVQAGVLPLGRVIRPPEPPSAPTPTAPVVEDEETEEEA